jgi:integrase
VGIIRVRRAHWHGHLKGTKTNRPRIVPLPQQLSDVLDAWRAEMIRKQHPGLEKGWCFPADKGGLRFTSSMTKPMSTCVEKAKLTKHVNMQVLRRSAEDILRRLGVAGAVAEAVMGHGGLMRHHYSTVAPHEVASIGPRIVEAIGLSELFVGDRVGDRGDGK